MERAGVKPATRCLQNNAPFDGLPKNVTNDVGALGCGVLPIELRAFARRDSNPHRPVNSGITEHCRLVTFRARPEIRTPNKPGLSRRPLPVGLDALDDAMTFAGPGRRSRTIAPLVQSQRASPEDPGTVVWTVGAGGVGPLVGRLSCGCTAVVLRARRYQGQDLHLQHTGSEPASSI